MKSVLYNTFIHPLQYLALAFMIFHGNIISGQQSLRHTVSGFVREAGSGELLTGVNVYLPDHRTGTVTNTYGFFSLTLPEADSVEITASYVGFSPQTKKISLREDTELNFDLRPGTLLDEVEISAERAERLSQSARMSTISVPVAQIKNIPSLLGEKDVLKVFQLMPGVQKGSEGSSGLYVRGGGPDQNLIILDDAIVYNASHLFGFFSLFNGDALKSVELTKGGFPARYGGRLSSVLEMNMKEGNKEKWHGEGGIGLISSRLTLEGPLEKNKSSILLSGRRTYVDLIMKPIIRAMEETDAGYYFYDLNAKINYDLGRRNKLYLSGYFGKDRFHARYDENDLKETAGLGWGNATATFRWNHLFSSRLFSNTSFVFSDYKFGVTYKLKSRIENENFRAEYFSGIRDLTLKFDLDYLPSPKHSVKAGGAMIFHRFTPYVFIEIDEPINLKKSRKKISHGLETGLYAEDTWQLLPDLKLNGGLRFSHFLTGSRQYMFLEPRLSATWKFNGDYALKASYASMNQYIHLISYTGISLPTDLWVPTTERVGPQQSRQVAFGTVRDLKTPDISLSIEGYYKTMNHVLGYKEGASFFQFDEMGDIREVNWEDNVTAGKAWSYGLEFLVHRKAGRFSGWIGYTLSWTQMQFDSLNYGKKFYARYDRRHDISLVGTYRIKKNITLSGTWVYGTGNAVTMPTSVYYAPDHLDLFPELKPESGLGSPFHNIYDVNEYSRKNNYRMAPYHRLDLGIQFHRQKKWGERIWEFSVYNVYNRKNPFFYRFRYLSSGTTSGALVEQVSLFPVIPSFTYSFKF
ncbi:MAG TPA: TonB-dependent receptor [Bacteroidales bacterium]|nr:TonB-dependent receptor [Bacteroidales bacterium]HPV15737.1 TonB-dependent receptor [Bacteroidales bacterium]